MPIAACESDVVSKLGLQDDVAAAFAFDDDSEECDNEATEAAAAGPAVGTAAAIAVGTADVAGATPDATGAAGAGKGPCDRSEDESDDESESTDEPTAATATGDVAPARLGGPAVGERSTGEEAATEGEADLGIGTINAVRKEEVDASAAARFNVVPRGIPEGLTPKLVSSRLLNTT